jgi:hypothetical protein
MAVSKNPIANKNYEGPVHGGEGKDKLKISGEPEFSGVYRSAPNPKLSPAVGYTSKRDGAEDSAGSINSKVGTTGYGGPQRFTPKNLGDRHPDDLQRS